MSNWPTEQRRGVQLVPVASGCTCPWLATSVTGDVIQLFIHKHGAVGGGEVANLLDDI